MKTQVQVEKEVTFAIQNSALKARLGTLKTLFGIEGIAKMVNEWLAQQDDLDGFWEMKEVVSFEELEKEHGGKNEM